jgi:hypothetical protein
MSHQQFSRGIVLVWKRNVGHGYDEIPDNQSPGVASFEPELGDLKDPDSSADQISSVSIHQEARSDPEAAYSHNFSSSTLQNLPVELILNIAEHLGLVDCFLLSRVCSKFRQCNILGIGLSELQDGVRKEAIEFRRRLRRDDELHRSAHYERMCDMAAPNSRLYRRGCSGCRKIHRVRQFSLTQLDRSPKERICQSLEMKFRLGPSHTITGHCLLTALREHDTVELWTRAG